MTAKHAHGIDCCWPCFNGHPTHPTTQVGEPDPLCDENCPVPDEEEA